MLKRAGLTPLALAEALRIGSSRCMAYTVSSIGVFESGRWQKVEVEVIELEAAQRGVAGLGDLLAAEADLGCAVPPK